MKQDPLPAAGTENDCSGATPPPRPLVGVCAAVFAGSLAGSSGWLDPCTSRPASCALGLALATLLALRSSVRRRSLMIVLLALIACAAAQRASPHAPGPAPSAVPETSDADARELRRGVWSMSGVFGDEERGQLAGAPERFDLAHGLVDDGDRIEILSSETPRSWPRGPEPGPSTLHGIAHPAARLLPDEIVRIAPASGALERRVGGAISALRARWLERCSGLEEPLTRALVKALLFGDMSEMPRGVSDLFVRVGTYHVLAISGSQVGLVAILILWPLSRLLAGLLARASLGRIVWPAELFHVVLLVAFVPIAGAGAPVLRAALSYALGACAPRAPVRRAFARVGTRGVRLGRRADALSLWCLALIFECLLHPSAPLSVSVRLSYGATLGLILGTGPILRGLRALFPHGARLADVDDLGRPRSAAWRVPVQRALDLAACSVAASVAAVLATLPFVWAHFGEWSPVGILATPALGLPVAWLLTLGWTWLCFPWAVPQVLLDLPARGMIAEMELFDLWPGSPVPLAPRPFELLLLATALSFAWISSAPREASSSRAASAPRDTSAHRDTGSPRGTSSHQAMGLPRSASLHRGPRPLPPVQDSPILAHAVHSTHAFPSARSFVVRSLAGRLALLAWAALLVPWTLAPARFELWVLDVGHGTCAAFRAPGSGAWIFDAGSRDRPDVAREALLPLLRAWDADELGIVLSHTDRDHDGALAYVLERYPPRVWAGALPAQCAERLAHTTVVLDTGPGRVELPALEERGDRLRLEIWRGSTQAGNEGSRSLSIHADGQSVLLCGDAEADGLKEMLRSNSGGEIRASGPLRLLLFPHHGSDTDQLERLLASTRPAEIWISCSQDPALLAELDRRGIRIRTTARDGPLHLDASAPQYVVPGAR